MIQVTATSVAAMALITALATGLGALPLAAIRRMPARRVGLANAMAAGLMLAASLMLLYEGGSYGMLPLTAGALTGWLFVAGSTAVLHSREDLHVGALQGADAMKALLIVGVMTLHSVTEGIGVGVSYGGGDELGVFITAAIAIHNVPEGLAIALVLVPRGARIWQAALWGTFSSLPQPLLAVPAFLAVETFESLLPAGLGFAAGAMIWMSFRELLPEALAVAPRREVAAVTCVALGAMLLFQVFLKG